MMLIVSFLITLVGLVYFSYRDLRYRLFSSYIPIIAIDIVAVGGCLITYGFNLVTIISSLVLFLPMYIIEEINQMKIAKNGGDPNNIIFGGIDIAIAPAITCWFGLLMPVFLVFYLSTLLIIKNKKIRKWLDGFCVLPGLVKSGYYPKIPFFTLAWLLSIVSILLVVFLI